MDNASELLARLDTILVGKRGDRTAPHKPLYFLLCVAGIQRGAPRLQRFTDIRAELGEALRIFGSNKAGNHPEYPFARLPNDGLAELRADGPLEIRKSNKDPKVSSLVSTNARGGLLPDYHDILQNSFDLQSTVIHRVLDAHFPPSIHEDVIQFFRLTLADRHATDRKSEIEFRDAVLSAYGNTCAISGFSLMLDGRPFGIEAAHVFWPQAGGNDLVSNGIAMTTLHRKLYHLGLFGVDDQYRVLVSSRVNDGSNDGCSLRRYAGQPLRLPERADQRPSLKAVRWHREWVFKG